MAVTIRNLLLWRHADAEVLMHGQIDMARALTKKGQRQAKQMAAWLKKYSPPHIERWVSPAQRALETAAFLPGEWQQADCLAPEQSLQHILPWLAARNAENVLLVGHQPWIGLLAAHAMGVEPSTLAIKKGAVWWLKLPKSGIPYQLYSVQAPDLLG